MKVLHIITGLEDGGAEAVLYGLCTEDTKNKHIVVSLKGEGKYGKLLNKKGIICYSLNKKIGNIFKLIWIIRKEEPDIIQTWLYHGNLIGGTIAKMTGCKVIWSIHNSRIIRKTKRLTRAIIKTNKVFSWFIRDGIIYCAQAGKST